MVIQTKEGCISKTPECTKVSKSALNSTVHLEVDKSAIVSIKRKKKEESSPLSKNACYTCFKENILMQEH